LSKDAIKQIFSTLMDAMRDYSTDKRGDVGSWVREAAMIAAEKITVALYAVDVQSQSGITILIVTMELIICVFQM
jgi:hypothetical protein